MSTVQRELLPHLMAIADKLEARQAPPPVAVTLRDTLLESSQALCADQGIAATQAQIAQAVDEHLANPEKGLAALGAAEYDFGWKRPTSVADRKAEVAKRDRPLRRLCRLGLPFRALLNPLGMVLLSVHLTFCIMSIAAVAVQLSMHGSVSLERLATGAVAVCMAPVWLRDVVRRYLLSRAPALEYKRQQELKRWWVARDYIRHALASTGDLMKGDLLEIDARIHRRSREIKEESEIEHREKQLKEMTTW